MLRRKRNHQHILQAIFLPLLVSSCATAIKPPQVVQSGGLVALLDHGRHSSLILPDQNKNMIRFSYGDWHYYALSKTGLFQGSAALFWPSQGALGRKILDGPISSQNIRNRIQIPIEEVLLIWVEMNQIQLLRNHLNEIYQSNLSSLTYNAGYDLEFVHHPKNYWIFHNSNQVVSEWLKHLGCHISGLALVSDWKLEP